MAQGSSEQKNNNEQASLFQAFVPAYPFRHKSYNSALDTIQSTLENKNAVILQGPERTGKSTLIEEIKQFYQQKGVEVISFTTAVNTPRQLYSLMAEALHVPKLKKDLVAALINAKNTGKYCLVVMDESAVNSSAATSEAMRKLCDPASKTAGAIKVIVVCTDYLVIHTKNTYETDFHDWIKNIVPLQALKAEELEALTHYLAGLKNCPTPQFETGTDIELIERSKGKIDSLITLINPLIDEAVISQSRFEPEDKGTHPLDSRRSKYYFLGAASVLVLIIGIFMRSVIIPDIETKEKSDTAEDIAIFKSEDLSAGQEVQRPFISPPVLDKSAQPASEKVSLPTQTTPEVPNITSAPKPPQQTDKPDNRQLDKIPALIDNWLQARKDHNKEEYLTFYGKNYSTRTTKGKSWHKELDAKFQSEKLLQLKRANLDIEATGSNEAKVEFWLDQINSRGAQSRIKKRLILSSDGVNWKISNELDLRVVKKL
jgi:aspartate/glutamate racemase